MIDNDKAAFAASLTAIASVHRVELSQPLLQAYWLALSDLTLDQLKHAVGVALREHRWMPKPAELRSIALSGSVDGDAMALASWSALLEAVRTVGPYKSVDFGDPTTHAAIRAVGGWQRVCDATSDELHRFIRRDYLAAYNGLACKAMSDEATAVLIGDHDASRRMHGLPMLAAARVELPLVGASNVLRLETTPEGASGALDSARRIAASWPSDKELTDD